MKTLLCALLCTSAMSAISFDHAQAETTKHVTSSTHRSRANDRSKENNAPSMMGSTAPTDIHEEQVSVHGARHRQIAAGLMIKEDAPKSRSTVTQEFIETQANGSNPMQLIALLPGVNTSDQDPLGMTGGNMTMRGLTSQQIGFTLEGFPINDIGSYAVYPQEIVDAENLRTINVEQGSADLDSPHISATGGAVDMYLRDPMTHFGGKVVGSYGTYNMRRIFGRVDTGYVGHTNLRGYMSFSEAAEDMWRGPGSSNKMHGETKWVNKWGDGNVVSLTIVGNHSTGVLFPSTRVTSAADMNAMNTGKGYNAMVNSMIKNNVYDAKWDPNNPSGNYYQLHRNPFTNIYASAPSTFKLSDNITLTETPYFWYGNGNGGGAYSTKFQNYQYGSEKLSASLGNYNASNTKSMLLYNPSNTQTYRPGSVTKITLHTGINRLEFGYWFEYSKQRQTGPYSLINPQTGQALDLLGGGPNLILSNGQTAEYRDTLTQTRIHTLFIADSLSLLNNRLNIEAGLKYTFVKRQGYNGLPDTSTGPYINGSWQQPLPAFSVRYKLNDENQLFASATTNFRIPMNTSLYDSGAYYSGSGYSTKANPNQKTEYSISEEAGWRYQGPSVMSSITFFHYNFTNRLYTQVITQPNGGYYTTSINGGGMHASGVDAEIGTRPFHNFRPYASFEYVDARTDNNLAASGGSVSDYVRSKGKYAPQTAKYQVGFNLDYDDGHFFSGFSLKYTGSQYATFTNDLKIPSYVRMNVHAGYRFKDMGFLKHPMLKLNIMNIANNHYLGFVSGAATNAKETIGVFGSKISGQSTSYMIASPFSVLGTASVDF
ncbi:TonB-dependent receptor [Gluconobacter wancherniae]|uniref:TonB-dependent receptor n=1 Tax=Gluconobacter wancherniae TaxID=1307955 RepID=UPI002012F019|nr:TonB-dependent receptor [Gluconobacter wancherniae]